jgi:hypothetical protein
MRINDERVETVRTIVVIPLVTNPLNFAIII